MIVVAYPGVGFTVFSLYLPKCLGSNCTDGMVPWIFLNGLE